MDKRERGISPAESTPKERRRRLSYPDTMQERDRLLKERGLEIAHEITSTFIIDQEGEVKIFRQFRDRLVIHPFESLPRALDQVERVIQQKLGFQRRIGEILVNVYGENEELVFIGSMLLIGADRYYELPLSSRKAYSKSLARKAKARLEKKHNVHKKAAAEVLQKIIESDDEFKDDAEELIKAGKDAFDAAISGVRIVSGETARLIRGQELFELWGNQSLKISERLASYYEQLKALNKARDTERRKELAIEMAAKFKDGGSFWQAIGEIKTNPFFGRFNSPSVKRLIKLPWELSTGRFENAENRLAKAVTELSALERDFDRGKIRLHPVKATSKP